MYSSEKFFLVGCNEESAIVKGIINQDASEIICNPTNKRNLRSLHFFMHELFNLTFRNKILSFTNQVLAISMF